MTIPPELQADVAELQRQADDALAKRRAAVSPAELLATPRAVLERANAVTKQ